MDLKQLKTKFTQMTADIETAIKAEDLDKAEELTTEAEGIQRQIAVLEKQAALTAKAAEIEKADREAEEATRADAVKAEVERQVEEALKKVGVTRPAYAVDTDDDETPQVLKSAHGPYDDVGAHELALGYMVLEAQATKTGRHPSKDFYRAVH